MNQHPDQKISDSQGSWEHAPTISPATRPHAEPEDLRVPPGISAQQRNQGSTLKPITLSNLFFVRLRKYSRSVDLAHPLVSWMTSG